MAIIERMPERPEQLAAEPTVGAEARAGLREGASHFDAGRFWDAHEAWEEVWQVEPRTIRSFYQGLIQVAAALHHWTVKRNPRGVAIMLERGIDKLEWYAPHYLGVDVDRLLDHARRWEHAAAEQSAQWLTAHPPNPAPVFPWRDGASDQ